MKLGLVRLVIAGGLLFAAANAIAQTQLSGAGWIIDPAAQCGTSNPFATGRETISWSGKCLRGRLHGPGVLIWFEDGVETERDEGTFRNGELDGGAVITLADHTSIFGNYRDGVRHGEFMILATDGSYIQSIYADGILISQKVVDRTETKTWRDARKGDSRITQLSIARPKQVAPSPQTGQRQVASADVQPAQPPQPRVAPTPVPPLVSVPSSVATPVPSPVPNAASGLGPKTPAMAAVAQPSRSRPARPTTLPALAVPAFAPAQTTSQNSPTVSVPATTRPREIRALPAPSSPTPIVAPLTTARTPAQAALPSPPPLMQYVRVDGQRLLTIASYIPGGINMVRTGSQATMDQFGEAKLLRRLLASAAPDPRIAGVAEDRALSSALPVYRAHRIPSAAATAFVAGLRPPSGIALRSPASQPIVLKVPPSAAVAPARNRVLPVGRQPTQLALRRPAAPQRITLRPPPGVPARKAVPLQSASLAAPPTVSAPPPPPASAAPENGRLALNLAGADLRDATGIILGDILKVRYTVDPDVRGTVGASANPSLTREELVPWLRGALQTNGADLVITPAGYRVFSLQRASAGAGAGTLPSLAPPQQAESIFERGYAAERAGRTEDAARHYTQLVSAYPATGIGAMARERLATVQARTNAPRRASALPAEVSMAGAYLCTRRGLYPNNSKWCGFVRGEVDEQLRVEIREISYNGLLAIGFSATTCTGGIFIGPLSHRHAVTVPRVCMEARW